jgi:TolA-binding protein
MLEKATRWSAWKSWLNEAVDLRMTEATGNRTRETRPMVNTSRLRVITPVYFRSASLLHLMVCLGFLCLLSGCGENESESLMKNAQEEWVKGRNHSAVELFKAVLEKNPSGPLAEEALFRLGEISHFSLGNSAQAIMYFQELMQLNKKGTFTHDAQKYVAEIVEFTFKDYEQAIIEYQKLIDRFDIEEEKSDHQYRIASIFFKMQNYEQALAEWEVLLEEYSSSMRAEESRYKVVEILYTLQRCSEARQHYDDFVEKYPTSKFKDEVEFIMASCLEEGGKLQEAYNRFKLLENNYPYPAILKTKMDGLEKRMKKRNKKKR